MKQKFLLSILFACTLVISTNAQINKGSVWLGGNLSYGQSKTDNDIDPDYKTHSFSIAPGIGKAVKDNLIVGMRINYQYSKSTTGTNYSDESQYGGSIFVRRYLPVISRLYVFGEGSVGANHFRSSGSKGGGFVIALTPGVSVGINKKLHLETGFNSLFSTYYMKRKTTVAVNNYSNESFGAGFNLENQSTFYLGFRILINNKA